MPPESLDRDEPPCSGAAPDHLEAVERIGAVRRMEGSLAGRGLLIDGFAYLSPREALPLLEAGAVLVDLRVGEERNGRSFGVGNVILTTLQAIQAGEASLPRDRLIIVADCVGLKSKKALPVLRGQGFESIASLIGGMIDWEQDGMPTVIDRDEELSGSCACKVRPGGKTRKAGC
jgi:rhodanese-related sulfurtransferase